MYAKTWIWGYVYSAQSTVWPKCSFWQSCKWNCQVQICYVVTCKEKQETGKTLNKSDVCIQVCSVNVAFVFNNSLTMYSIPPPSNPPHTWRTKKPTVKCSWPRLCDLLHPHPLTNCSSVLCACVGCYWKARGTGRTQAELTHHSLCRSQSMWQALSPGRLVRAWRREWVVYLGQVWLAWPLHVAQSRRQQCGF